MIFENKSIFKLKKNVMEHIHNMFGITEHILYHPLSRHFFFVKKKKIVFNLKNFMFREKKKFSKKSKIQKETAAERKMKNLISSPDFQRYIDNLKLFSSADLVLYIFDSRNPLCCLYQPYQELLGDRFIAVLNKIDLIPRESTLSWLYYFSKTYKTVAISAVQSIEPLTKLLNEPIPNQKSETGKRIVITGVGNVGKRTVFDKIKTIPGLIIQITQPYSWIKPTPDLCVIGSNPYSSISDSKIASFRDFIGRCSIHSVMQTFGVSYFNEPDAVLKVFNEKKGVAAQEFFLRMIKGDYLFYTSTSSIDSKLMMKTLSEEQKNTLKCSMLFDQYQEPFLCLAYPQVSGFKERFIPALHYFATHKDDEISSE